MSTIVNDLRKLADFLETRPLLAELFAINDSFSVYPAQGDFARAARELGSAKKEVTSMFFCLKKKIGPLTLSVVDYRENVCTRRVVGTREVPEQHVPEKVIPAHVEEIVEWECPDSILAGETADA